MEQPTLAEKELTAEELYRDAAVSVHIDIQPIEITLTKGQRGSYGWEIKAKAKTVDEAMVQIIIADAKLNHDFPAEESK